MRAPNTIAAAWRRLAASMDGCMSTLYNCELVPCTTEYAQDHASGGLNTLYMCQHTGHLSV